MAPWSKLKKAFNLGDLLPNRAITNAGTSGAGNVSGFNNALQNALNIKPHFDGVGGALTSTLDDVTVAAADSAGVVARQGDTVATVAVRSGGRGRRHRGPPRARS